MSSYEGYEDFDYSRVPPVCFHLGLISRVERIIELAKRDKCLDCIPRTHLIPWAPDGYQSEGVWVIVQFHDVSCPSFRQGGAGMEMFEE